MVEVCKWLEPAAQQKVGLRTRKNSGKGELPGSGCGAIVKFPSPAHTQGWVEHYKPKTEYNCELGVQGM